MIGGNLAGAGMGVLLVDNIQALQDPVALAAVNAIFGGTFRYAGQKTGEKLASDLVKASRVVKEKVTPGFHESSRSPGDYGAFPVLDQMG